MSDLSTAALLRRAILYTVLAIAAYAAGIVFLVQSASIGVAFGLSKVELLLVASAALSLVPRLVEQDGTTPPSSWPARAIVGLVMAAAYAVFLKLHGWAGVAEFAAALVFCSGLFQATKRILPISATEAELKRRKLQRDVGAHVTSGAASA